jgi:hypothetical protein
MGENKKHLLGLEEIKMAPKPASALAEYPEPVAEWHHSTLTG